MRGVVMGSGVGLEKPREGGQGGGARSNSQRERKERECHQGRPGKDPSSKSGAKGE